MNQLPQAAAVIAALALAAGARAEPMTMLIWGGGRTPEAAAQAMARWKAAGPRAGLTLPEGFPRIMDSTPIQGLKPGFQIVVLGFCAPEPGAAALARMKAVDPGAYLRNVDYPALACPEVLPQQSAKPAGAAAPPAPEAAAPAPGPQLQALVVATGKDRADLEARATKLRSELGAKLRFAPGYPRVEARKQLALDVGAPDEPYWLVLGVCPEKRASILHYLLDANSMSLRSGATACPEVLDGARVRTVELALWLGDTAFALDLLARPGPLADADRRSLAVEAGRRCAPEVLEKLMAAGPIDATEALGAAAGCSSRTPEDAARAERTVRRLLAGGAMARGHGEWIAAALEHGNVPVAQQLLAAGADPRSAAGQVMAAARSSPAALAWAIAQHVDVNAASPEGETALERAVIDGDLAALRTLLQAGANASLRAKDGLTPLDRVLLPGHEPKLEVRKALLAARPAFAAAAAGDVKALGALPPASLGEAWGGWSPLAVAAVLGQDPAALFLLDHGARADLRIAPGREDGGHDVLSLAIDGGATKLALRLVLRGGALDTPAGSCAFVPPSEPAPILVDPARDPSQPRRAYAPKLVCVKLRPIHRAAMAGQLLVVQALLAQRVDPNTTDASGRGLTATMLAAETGHDELLKPLAAKGANAALADATGHGTVAHALFRPESRPALDTLERVFGPGVFDGAPGALVVAVMGHDDDSIERLLAGGAGKKGEGRRALSAACDYSNEPAFNLLRSKGYSIGKEYWGGCVGFEGD